MNASGENFSEKTPKLWYHWNWEAHLGFPQSFGAAITRNYHEITIRMKPYEKCKSTGSLREE